MISGTPTVVTANTTYTITGANAGGSAMTTVDIEVVALAAPSALSYSDNPASYTKDVPIAQNLPTVTATVTSWTITAGLPAGLSFDTAIGGISGTPTAAAANATFTVTALNPAGQVTEDLDIEVLDVMGTVQSLIRRGQIVHIGTDAQKASSRMEFVTVACVLNPGKGGRVFYTRRHDRKEMSLYEKLSTDLHL